MLNVEYHNYGLDFHAEYRSEMVLVNTVSKYVVLATETLEYWNIPQVFNLKNDFWCNAA